MYVWIIYTVCIYDCLCVKIITPRSLCMYVDIKYVCMYVYLIALHACMYVNRVRVSAVGI